jgi:hypothetical protein
MTPRVNTNPDYWRAQARALWRAATPTTRANHHVASGYALAIAASLEGDPHPLTRMLEAHGST